MLHLLLLIFSFYFALDLHFELSECMTISERLIEKAFDGWGQRLVLTGDTFLNG